MTIALYMDVHVHRAITVGLRLREVDVLTAQEDGYRTATDTRLLDRATEFIRPICLIGASISTPSPRILNRKPLIF